MLAGFGISEFSSDAIKRSHDPWRTLVTTRKSLYDRRILVSPNSRESRWRGDNGPRLGKPGMSRRACSVIEHGSCIIVMAALKSLVREVVFEDIGIMHHEMLIF